MYDLVSRTNRRDDLEYLVTSIASYTLDSSYVSSYQVWWGDTKTTRKIQPLGSIMALNPANRKVVPNFTSYGFGVIGILAKDAMAEYGDVEVPIIFTGVVNEKAVWDDGEYQNLLQVTRDALADRIKFVDTDNLEEIW